MISSYDGKENEQSTTAYFSKSCSTTHLAVCPVCCAGVFIPQGTGTGAWTGTRKGDLGHTDQNLPMFYQPRNPLRAFPWTSIRFITSGLWFLCTWENEADALGGYGITFWSSPFQSSDQFMDLDQSSFMIHEPTVHARFHHSATTSIFRPPSSQRHRIHEVHAGRRLQLQVAVEDTPIHRRESQGSFRRSASQTWCRGASRFAEDGGLVAVTIATGAVRALSVSSGRLTVEVQGK